MNEPQPPPSAATPPKSGLSVTSLVLGILSIVGCSLLTGIPAIITGHIANGRAKKQPELFGGAGMALAGLIMGYVSIAMALLLIPILAGLLLPALAKAKGKAQTVSCVSNLKQVALAARMWSGDHNEILPPDFLTMSNELNTPKILVCASDNSKTRAENWSDFDASQNVTYEFVTPNIKEPDLEAASQTVIFRCPIHGNVAMADGSVHQRGSPGRRR